MAVDQDDVAKRIEAGCAPRIERSGERFLIVLDGPAPSGVVCAGDGQKQFPSWQHAADWLARFGIGRPTRETDEGQVAALTLVVIRSRDLAASREFYESIGLRFQTEQHESGPLHYSCKLGDTVVELYPHGSRGTAGLRLGFAVDSLPTALARIAALGGSIVSSSADAAVVDDPDGHRIELAQRR